MTRRLHTPGQILEKLRDSEALSDEVHSMGEIEKRVEVSKQTPHRRRDQCRGVKGVEMKRLKKLERCKRP